MQLTSHQYAAATHTQGHARVIAVAGSGKTSTLIERIHQLLKRGADPRRITVLMYNKSAQQDFLQRLNSAQTVDSLPLPEIRTFHSLGLRIYKSMVAWGALPAPATWKPMTRGQIDRQIIRLLRLHAPKEILESLGSNEFKEQLAEPMLTFLEFCKSRLLSPEIIFEELGFDQKKGYFIHVYHAFEEHRRQSGLITYADMLHTPVTAMLTNTTLAEKFSNHMDYILVDEYQDIDDIQAELLSIIAGQRAQVMIIGDPDQCIYSFRGAVVEHIVSRFDDRFLQATDYPIPHTFRYGPQLALLANHLITQNQTRANVLCLSAPSTPATEIHLTPCDNEEQQIISTIKAYRGKGKTLSDMAIVVRLWAQAVKIELELLEQNIPYQTSSPYSVFKRQEIRNLISFLQWSQLHQQATQQRELTIRTALEFPRLKIKQQQLQRASAVLATQWSENNSRFSLKEANLNTWEARQIRERIKLLNQLSKKPLKAAKFISTYINETELIDWLEENASSHESGTQRAVLVSAFVSYAERQNLSTVDMVDHLIELESSRSTSQADAITITSIHKAKGLEWPIVFVPGLSRKYVPYLPEKIFVTPGGIEAERRLLYVGITRAKQNLHLYTPAKSQSPFVREMKFETSKAYGQQFDLNNSDIDATGLPFATRVVQDYARTINRQIFGAPTEDTHVEELTYFDTEELQTGQKLCHKLFGYGKITATMDGKFRVSFENGKVIVFPISSAAKYFS